MSIAYPPRRCGASIVACYPEKYKELLDEKVTTFRNLMSKVTPTSLPVEINESERTHFRMRANFNVWRDNPKDFNSGDYYYVMFDDSPEKRPCEIVSFPRGTQRINELMVALKEGTRDSPALFRSLFEARFVTATTGEAVVVLLYKRPLPQDWLVAATVLADKLQAKVVGRARKQMVVAGGSEVIREVLHVGDRDITYFQTEGAFSQPNAKVCEKMLQWAMAATRDSHTHDLLELYCGGGTFTIALAANFRSVLATEMSKASVELAQQAITANHVTNIKIARLSAEEFSAAYSKTRHFQRLTEAGIKLDAYDLRTVFVDPPRAGIDADTCRLLCRFDKIVYVSCNPVTLARDVEVMAATHEVTQAAVFDQFPYTHHLESGVVLVKRQVPLASALSLAQPPGSAVAAEKQVEVLAGAVKGEVRLDSEQGDGEEVKSVLGKRSAEA